MTARRRAFLTELGSLGVIGLGGATLPRGRVQTVSECTVIDEPGEYRLGRDLGRGDGEEGEPCIHITADDVTLDGQGHTISAGEHNVKVVVTGDDVTVRDVRFRGDNHAMEYRGVDDGLVEDCDSLCEGGIFLVGCEDVLVQNNVIRDDNEGVRMENCDNCRAADNVFDGNDNALIISGGKDSSSARNIFDGPIDGISLSGFRNRTYRDVVLYPADFGVKATGKYARILETTVTGAETDEIPAFRFKDLNRLVAVNCMALEADGDGFLVEDSRNVRMEDCHAHDNGGHGIAFRDVDGAQLIRNRAWDNDGEGFSVDTDSSGIRLEGNIFDD